MNLDTKALIGFFKEIEASRDRQKAETEFQRDVFKRAKEKHFDAKAMRIVLQRRAMDATKRDEQDYNVDCYERALAGKKLAVEALERGATVREAAEAGGISTGAAGNLAKVVQKSSFVDTETALDPPPSPKPEFEVGAGTHSVEQGDRQSPLRDGGAPVATSAVGPAVTTSFAMALGAESIARREAKHAADDLAIPPFLKREKVTA